jgi:glycosyltransferase involved in cell wall biosynthesis
VDAVGIDAGKIVVLPNGADPDVFVPGKGGEDVRRRYRIEDRFVIGFVGILRPWHGVDLLLEAFCELRISHPAVHLLIVGDGPIQAQLESRARDLGCAEAVTFTGRLTHQDVVAHVAAMDVAVSPHATFYASPMKILEYMAMGKPLVAPAMDNIRDIVDDGETGMLFEPGNTTALAATLCRVSGDQTLREQLGRLARGRVVERFNWRLSALRVVDEAGTLLGRVRSSTDRQPGVARPSHQ